MVQIKSIHGTVVKVNNVERIEGVNGYFAARNRVTRRFLNAYPMLYLTSNKTADGRDIVAIRDTSMWQPYGNTRKKRKPIEAENLSDNYAAAATSAQSNANNGADYMQQAAAQESEWQEIEQVSDTESETQNTQTDTSMQEQTQSAAEQAHESAQTQHQNNNADMGIEGYLRKIVRDEISNSQPQQAQPQTQIIEIHNDNFVNTLENEIVCEDFADIVQDVHDGHFVYLYGAAGCGKSHTAKQVADALGLDFYPMQQLLFAHDVQGYGDAHGNYIETPFYKAFTQGGLVFLDEWDSSSPEAALVVNGAIANGRFTFPVVGNKTAHKDFRIIAAGNTVGTGADMNYTGRNILDASTLDRMTFYEMHYDERVELPIMARGNKELYDFVVALRKAVGKAGVNLIVSYRATAYMATRTENKVKTLKRCTLKGMGADDIRMINAHTEIEATNAWKKALSEIAQ